MKEMKSIRVPTYFAGALALLLSFAPLSGQAADKFPQGKDYPVSEIYKGKPAEHVDNSDEFTHMFRTRFKEAMQGDIAFAGEYTQAGWGCGGSGCHVVAFINKRTGRALDKAFSVYYGGDNDEITIGEDIVYMDKNSKLLVTSGMDETTNKFYSYYYVLKGNKLELILKSERKEEK